MIESWSNNPPLLVRALRIGPDHYERLLVLVLSDWQGGACMHDRQ